MKRSIIVAITIFLLVFSGLVSCSKDKPTENGSSIGSGALVGTWELTTTKADGVVITEENDQWDLYDPATMILRVDSTGLISCIHGTQEILNWYTDGAYIVLYIVSSDDGETLVRRPSYTIEGNTLTTYFPGAEDEQYNYPDVEYTFTRQ